MKLCIGRRSVVAGVVAIVSVCGVLAWGSASAGATGLGGEVFGGGAPEKGRLFVLSIGIDKYKSPKIPGLQFAKADAEAAGRELTQRAGSNIYTEVKAVRYLLDEQASRAGILSALDALETEIAVTDTLIVFFAGSGSAYENQTHRGIEFSDAGRTNFYLFPSDMDPDNVADTGISSELLQVYLRKVRSRNKLFVFDSCHSAFGYDSIAETFTRRGTRISDNVLFIGVDTLSYDDPRRRHGALTSVVLDGLQGAADFDRNGTITARELEAYVYQGTLPYTELFKPAGVHPRTIFSGNDFNIALSDQELLKIKYEKYDAAALSAALDELKPKYAAFESAIHPEQLTMMEQSRLPLIMQKAAIDKEIRDRFPLKGGGFMMPPEQRRLQAKSNEKGDEIKKVDREIAAKKAELEAKKKELERLNAEIKAAEEVLAAKRQQTADPMRAEAVAPKGAPKPDEQPRKGQDYALLFANDDYENWSDLKNPYNDVAAISRELETRYGFKKENIAVLRNLTKAQMDDVLDRYQGGEGRKAQVYSGDGQYSTKQFRDVTFDPDDQLFVFFAGHGHVYEVGKDGEGRPVVNGLLVASDSPKFSKADKDKFIRLDDLLTQVNLIPNNHIMIVLDACFSGQIWRPKVLPLKELAFINGSSQEMYAAVRRGGPNAGLDEAGSLVAEMSRTKYIRQNLGKRSRVVFTSGGEAVPDGYCEEYKDGLCVRYSEHSPFAAKFIEALKQNGKNFNVLLGYEMIPFFKTLDRQRVEKGRLDDISDGDFLFIAPSEK